MTEIRLNEGQRQRLFKGIVGNHFAGPEEAKFRLGIRLEREYEGLAVGRLSDAEKDKKNRAQFGAQAFTKLRKKSMPEIDTKAKREGEKRNPKPVSKAARFIEGPSSNWTEDERGA